MIASVATIGQTQSSGRDSAGWGLGRVSTSHLPPVVGASLLSPTCLWGKSPTIFESPPSVSQGLVIPRMHAGI